MTDVYCWNCAYFADDAHECRRYAPRPAQRGERKPQKLRDCESRRAAEWPVTSPRSWCGEFEVSEEEPEGGWMRQGHKHEYSES